MSAALQVPGAAGANLDSLADLGRKAAADPWPRAERRHLLHVFPNFNVGGAQVRFAALVAGLGDGFWHTVVSLNGSYEAAALVPPGSRVQYAQPPGRLGSLPGRLLSYRAHLAGLQPDLLMTYNWGTVEFAFANLLHGAPHLHMEDGFGPEEATRQLPRRVWGRRIALARSHVLVPSRTLHTIATRTWRLKDDRVHYIPNGLASRREPITPLGGVDVDFPGERPRIIWVGALRPEKNALRLLNAFAPIKDRAVLVMVGDGPERAAVEAEASRLALGASLHLLGRRGDARDLIMQADILALSSDTEQMPFAVLEAMDAGLPVASTHVGDVRRMVASGNRPFIVAPDSVALGGALQALVDDSGLRLRIGLANRRRARRLFSLDRMVDSHTALLERLTGQVQRGLAAHA
jgi:glycosyltransferase involved in cell wall biosynthesis